MIRSRFGLPIAGIATLIVGLIVLFPARVAYHWAAPPDVKLSGISGSLWSGSAVQMSVNGLYARDLRWQLQPLALFTAKLAYAIEASPTSGFAEGSVAIGLGGSVTLTDVSAAVSLQALEQTLGIPGIRGDASLQLDNLKLVDGFPVAAAGVVEISNLRVRTIARTPIGGYRAEIFTQETGIGASVEDTDGVIDLAGSLQLTADRSYQFIAQLAAKEDAPASIGRQLQFLGSANDRGQHELRLEGQL